MGFGVGGAEGSAEFFAAFAVLLLLVWVILPRALRTMRNTFTTLLGRRRRGTAGWEDTQPID
jgi:hypothetical protein